MRYEYTRGRMELQFGYFYRVWTSIDDIDEVDSPNTIHSSGGSDEDASLVLERVSSVRVYPSQCCTWSIFNRVRYSFDYHAGAEVAPIARIAFSGEFVCRQDLAFQLLDSPLVGISIGSVKILSPDQIRDKWYHLEELGSPAVVQGKCEPGPYKCWKCGCEPICTICGAFSPTCPSCGEAYFVLEEDWQGPSDRRLVMLNETGTPDTVIDLQRWDGSDFFPHGVMTHRMLLFLQSVHAHPFHAVPLAVNVHGANMADLKRLECARGQVM